MGHYWQINDSRLWSTDDAAFVERAPDGAEITPLYDSGQPGGIDYLRETIRFYGYRLGELAGADEREAAFSALIEARMDAFALEKDYGTMDTARLAALSMEYAADGPIANAAYDTTWAAAIALIPKVRAGELTPEEAVAQLPALAWPD
jgi:hypothetical protein